MQVNLLIGELIQNYKLSLNSRIVIWVFLLYALTFKNMPHLSIKTLYAYVNVRNVYFYEIRTVKIEIHIYRKVCINYVYLSIF